MEVRLPESARHVGNCRLHGVCKRCAVLCKRLGKELRARGRETVTVCRDAQAGQHGVVGDKVLYAVSHDNGVRLWRVAGRHADVVGPGVWVCRAYWRDCLNALEVEHPVFKRQAWSVQADGWLLGYDNWSGRQDWVAECNCSVLAQLNVGSWVNDAGRGGNETTATRGKGWDRAVGGLTESNCLGE